MFGKFYTNLFAMAHKKISLFMVITLCCLPSAIKAVPLSPQQHLQQQQKPPLHLQSPQSHNYKQQLQYQMQQKDKYEYQQHMQQQQQYYQQHYQQKSIPQQQQQHHPDFVRPTQYAVHQQQQYHLTQPPPTSVDLVADQQHSYFAVRPTQFFSISLQMLQTAASMLQEEIPQADALRGQPEYLSITNDNTAVKRRPGNRKRKRRPQVAASNEGVGSGPTAPSPITYWREHNEEENLNNESTISPSPTYPTVSERRSTPGVRRRKPSTIREPLAALEKEQKLYELRNSKPESTPAATTTGNRNSENLKNILKNNGGLSLSEILQQKNLSLDDLLKGKQNALQALQTTATSPAQNPLREPITRYSPKPKFKLSTTSAKPATEQRNDQEAKDHSKLTALQKLKLFGASSRPSGIQVGLADHLTTRKKEGPLYSTTTTSSTTTTTTAAPTTRIPLYKKFLQQRSTLRPAFLLKNSQIVTSMEPEHVTTQTWDEEEDLENGDQRREDEYLEDNNEEEDEGVEEYHAPTTLESTEATTWRPITTTTRKPVTSTTTTTTTTTTKPSATATYKEVATSTRRMFSSTRGLGRTTSRFTPSISTTAKPSTTSTTAATTTLAPQTTTPTTTSTTTASSSTMNLTPKANLNLNTDDIRERIQETLLKNLIEKEDALKKATATSHEMDSDDDLENFFEETVKPKSLGNGLDTSTITTRMKQYSTSTASPYSTPQPSSTAQSPDILPDFDNVDDRTDLLELIEDRRSGNRLFKVLEQRNMTLDELIEHRKRGSSQLHLSTIVQTPSRYYPNKKVLLQDNMDIVTAFENFPHFNLLNLKSVKPDDIKTDSQGSSYFTSIIDIEPTDEIYKSAKGTGVLAGDKASLFDRSHKSLFPSWQSLALASLASNSSMKTANKKGNQKLSPFYLPQPKMLLDNNSDDVDYDYEIRENELVLINGDDDSEDAGKDDGDVDYKPQSPVQAAVRVAASTNLDAVDNIQSRAHDLVDLELSGHGFKRSPLAAGALAANHKAFYANMPAGIKSAIVASATIVLTALVTFMVIFAVFRWRQKHNRMTNIMKSYNAMKSKLPPIATTTTAAASASLNAADASCTRHSSLREMNSLLGGSGLSVAATITTTTTGVPNTPSPTASQTTVSATAAAAAAPTAHSLLRHSSRKNHQLTQLHHLHRPNSLLFRTPSNTNQEQQQQQQQQHSQPTNLSILSNCNLTDLKRSSDLRGSTTSLSFSLTSGHNIANTHMNSMDANSPEVQEYLFDTLRNSF
ncbi:nuclear pore complex protein DDB_G0274915 isoform X1 [Stomoxys calcitrans]|uniref:nuclear pore complex protein DDB_G0274915 isoform X1 n=1 Tax=Stomoxys calcitrans TaxID=35570 RepID=UPI0027E30E20|nr:nuclear pore complex protein DDB_G0274915 isoform X1 [Stomoxys calcitrans]